MIPAFIINLKRCPERKEALQKKIIELGLDTVLQVYWFEAVDGNFLDAVTTEYGVNMDWHEPSHKKPMTKGEVGCALSHWSIWSNIANNESALIFEDDIIFQDDFAQYIKLYLDSLPKNTDMAYIHRKMINPDNEEKNINEHWSLARASYWNCAYYVTKKGAQALMSTQYIKSLIPVDEFLPFIYDTEYNVNHRKACNVTFKQPIEFNVYALCAKSYCGLNDNFSFNTSNTFHSPSFAPLKTTLHAFTFRINGQNTGSLTRWIYSCQTYGIPYTVLDCDSIPDNILSTILENNKSEYVLYSDHRYSFIIGNPQEILQKHASIDKNALIGDDKIAFVAPAKLCISIADEKNILLQYLPETPDTLNIDPNIPTLSTYRSLLKNETYNTNPKIVYCHKNSIDALNSLSNYTLYGLRQGYGYKLESKIGYPTVDIYVFFESGTDLGVLHALNNLNYPQEKLNINVITGLHPIKELLQTPLNAITPTYYMMSSEDGHKLIEKSNYEYVWLLYEKFEISDPDTLLDLVNTDKDVVAPLMTKHNHLFSTFWGAVKKNGYYLRSNDYDSIVYSKIKNCWCVPHITGNILIKHDVLMRQPNLFTKEEDIDLDMSICQKLRNNNELLHVLNIKKYGAIHDFNDRDFHQVIIKAPSFHKKQWTPTEYLHPKFLNFLKNPDALGNPRDKLNSKTIFKELCFGVWHFPLFTEDFCDALVAEAENYGNWSAGKNNKYDPRLHGKHENHPTQDIHLNQIGLEDFWVKYVVNYLFKIVMWHLFKYQVKGINIAFIVRYKFGDQIKLDPHHDSSVYTTNVSLNHPGVDYDGGGCRFLHHNFDFTHNPKGWAVLHPGRVTHYHEALEISRGTRYILVSFNE